MKTQTLGVSDLTSTRLIYGCMRTIGTGNLSDIDRTRKEQAKAAIQAAYDAGYTHFDHADIYGRGACESVFGEWLREHRGTRGRLILTSKCGIRRAGEPGEDAPHRYDFSKQHIVQSCEQSLRRLGVDTIDLYLLHRPDVLMDPPQIAEAFDELREQGKVRWFGVSNFTVAQFEDLQAALDQPLVCNQIEIHPGRLAPIEDGTLNTMRRLGVTPTAWSPIGGGAFGDGSQPRDDHTGRIQKALDDEAQAHGVSRTAITLAWLMKHPSGIMPIVGSRHPDRIRDAVAADEVELSREAWYRIYLAARGKALP